jgi:hypothetical protein
VPIVADRPSEPDSRRAPTWPRADDPVLLDDVTYYSAVIVQDKAGNLGLVDDAGREFALANGMKWRFHGVVQLRPTERDARR